MDRALTRAFVCKSGNDIDSQERLEGLTREKNDIRRPEGSILGPMWSGDSVVKNSGGKRVSGDTSWKKKIRMEMRMEEEEESSLSLSLRRSAATVKKEFTMRCVCYGGYFSPPFFSLFATRLISVA